MRKIFVALTTAVALALIGSPLPTAVARPASGATPGAAGIGDPYFPTDGNGGYDVHHYDLDLQYSPATDRLAGTATIRATSKQNLSRFNLDLDGLSVHSVRVNGRAARWQHVADELMISPRHPLAKGERFTVVVRYGGIPKLFESGSLGSSGVFTTDDGALIVGQPHVADSWFPVNDHPLDKASYRIRMTVPRGLTVVANGRLAEVRHHRSTSTWTWIQAEPMASYLATATMGRFRLTTRRVDGVTYRDAIDPTLFDQPKPRTGRQYAVSGGYDAGYQRLSRTIIVPAGGGRLDFVVNRRTEPNYDYFFVEARSAGTETWTTLPDTNGHTSQSTGASCPSWLELHPFLAHYQSPSGADGCTPTGTTGTWHAATGSSAGYERWSIDLSPYAGTSVEISLTVATDEIYSYEGVYLDDIVAPTGQGSTSFEPDGAPSDGWTASGPPAGSPTATGTWRVTDRAISPSVGDNAAAALSRAPEIISFLSSVFGPYPFREAGGIVDNEPRIGFALENQTRPIYSQDFFLVPGDNTSVVSHELAHQWTGDDLALARWQDIWLNEGFATYASWLWSEDQGGASAQQFFESYAVIPADDPFWTLPIGDPGAERLFDTAVYNRGAMTLHALRQQLGDATFFKLVKQWTRSQAGGNVSTPEFHALAERVSGQDLDAFFTTWLATPAKPSGLPESTNARTRSVPGAEKLLARTPLRR